MAKPPQIQPITASKWIRKCIFADPGVGKTTYAGSAGAKCLIIHPPTDHLDALVGTGAEHWEVRGWDDMAEVGEWARHEGNAYEWIWLDSASQFQDVGLDDIFEAAKERNPNRANASYDQGDYRINMNRLASWVRAMIGCEMFHFGLTAHCFWMDYEEDGETHTKRWPWIQGKGMPNRICGSMNVVGYLNLQDVRKADGSVVRQRVLTCKESPDFIAKDLVGALGESGRMINPTIPKFMEAVRGGKSRTNRTPTRRRRP